MRQIRSLMMSLIVVMALAGCGAGGTNHSAAGGGTVSSATVSSATPDFSSDVPAPPTAATGTVSLEFAGLTAKSQATPQPSISPQDGKQASGLPPPDGTGAAYVPSGVDSFETTFRDSAGKVVYGPIETPASTLVEIPDVPTTAVSAEVDFLRNGGYALYTDTPRLRWDGNRAAVHAQPQAAPPSTSNWKSSVDDNGVAHFQVSEEGRPYKEFIVKGVAYSPAPIGYNTDASTDIGDLFWESPHPEWFIDWKAVWKRDLDNMRKLGINCIRVYNLSAYHLAQKNGQDYLPDLTPPITDPNVFVFTHQEFLDACWNNGDRPIYVLVGIGTPAALWKKEVADLASTDDAIRKSIIFWNASIAKTTEEVGKHPAVLGFTMFNELMDPAHFDGSNPAWTQYFWSQVQKNEQAIHANAPNKLVGWATHDVLEIPEHVVKHADQAKGLDFFGVNSYQTENASVSLDPYRKARMGDMARPVVATEFGYPSTGHRIKDTYFPYATAPTPPRVIPGDPAVKAKEEYPTLDNFKSLYEDAVTRKNTASRVAVVLPTFYTHPACVGVTYFEWSDEWWKEKSKIDFLVPDGNGGFTTVFDYVTDALHQWGGVINGGYPNGYDDEDAFGLYSIGLNGRRADQVFSPTAGNVAGNTRPDILTPRQDLLDTVLGVFSRADSLRPLQR